MLQIRTFSLKFLETSQLKNICVVFIYRYLNFGHPRQQITMVFLFPTLQPVQHNNIQGEAKTRRRRGSAARRRVNVLVSLKTGEPTPMLHLNSHHNTLAHKQLLVFPWGGGIVVCFPFFFFYSKNSKYRNPPRGKMIRSDSTLNQLFPLCGHCFLFFAVKQAKQAVKRPEPLERTTIVC